MSQISQIITQFDTSQKAIEGQAPSVFRENASYSWSFLANFAQEISLFIPQANALRNEVNSSRDSVMLIKSDIESIKNDIDTKKTQIDLKHQEVMSKVIPTEATYNETTIDGKVRMSQILNLIGA